VAVAAAEGERVMGDASREWSVGVELGLDGSQRADEVEEAAEELLDALAEAAPAVGVSAASLGVQLSVRARSAVAAVKVAVAAVEKASADVRLAHTGVYHAEASTTERLDAWLRQPSFPELVGTSEVAALLGVSRQRVSELSRAAHFPQPMTSLASGPVWAKPGILRFMDEWDRAPGRRRAPQKTPAAEQIVPMSVARLATKTRKTK
jgi:hypothetical protein